MALGLRLRGSHSSCCASQWRGGMVAAARQAGIVDGANGLAMYTWGNSVSSSPAQRLPTLPHRRSFGIGAQPKVSKGTVMLVDKHLSTGVVASAQESRQDDKHVRNFVFGGHGQTKMRKQEKDGPKRPHWSVSGQQYSIPAPYRDLLDRVTEDPGTSHSAQPDRINGHHSEKVNAESPAPEGVMGSTSAYIPDTSEPTPAKSFSFWPAARKLVKTRLETNQPDVEPWEHRASKFHESLWIEELRLELEMVHWRMTASSLPMVSEGLYKLDITPLIDIVDIPLEEKGVLRGTNVHLKCSSGKKYRGMVQPGSGGGNVLLSSTTSLAHAQGPFEVRFHANRFQQLAMHRALDAPQNADFLRTAYDDPAPPIGLDCRDETANTLPASLNDDQRRAVAGVLNATTKRPLVIWGPPGTGKSTLCAFVIWHLVQQRPSNLCILAAAPSNTGADVLCKKLGKLGLGPEQVLRMNALGRNVGTVPDEIRPFCFSTIGENGRPAFGVPPLSQARKFKVIVTTCIAATHLVNALRLEGSEGWFSHVIVDEAGEATEPEMLVPLSLLRKVGGSSVLLGDHFQLGPLVMSKLASQVASLEVSMIERLANERFSAVRDCEERSGMSPDTLLACEDHGLFFLTQSYRSHSAITRMYSDIFYAGQLVHMERMLQSSALPFFSAQGFDVPVIFHNVVGQERRDPESPSVYNIDELRIVQQYIVDLLADENCELRASDIGVITPYTKQLQTLQDQLASMGSSFAGLECGTVEWFQGQERSIVIMSTVRCSKLADGSVAPPGAERRPIGFVADPKRLNVAISRAIAGLIIVGDLRTLAMHSSHWRQLVDMAKEIGSITGEPLTEGPRGWEPLVESRPEDVKTAVPAVKASAAWDALTSS